MSLYISCLGLIFPLQRHIIKTSRTSASHFWIRSVQKFQQHSMPIYRVRDAIEFMRDRFGFTPHPPVERVASGGVISYVSGQARTSHYMDPHGSSTEETPLTPQIVAQAIQDFLTNILNGAPLHRLSEGGHCFSFPKSQKVFPAKEVHQLPKSLEELLWFLNHMKQKVHASNAGIPGVGSVSEVSVTSAMECDDVPEVVSDDPESTIEIPFSESVA